MRLKPTIKGMASMKPAEKKEPVKKQQKKKNTLPPDEYKPLFPPIIFLVRESYSPRNPSYVIKQYIEISVKRFNDSLGLPYVWLQMYQESDLYTGYLRGKCIYFPLEMFEDVLSHLYEIDEECQKRKIE